MAGKKAIVTGIPEIDRKLRSLPTRVANKVVRQAMRAALRPLAAAAAREAPEGVTGDLERSIKVRSGKRSRSAIRMGVVVAEDNFRNRKKFYAAFEHLGHRVRVGRRTGPGRKKEFGDSKVPPDPFMRRAYDSGADAAKATAEHRIRDGIEREARA